MYVEGADGAFGRVAFVDIRRHKLVVTFPFLRDYTAVLLDDLLVDYLEVHLVATLLEAEHDAPVGRDTMKVLIGLEGLNKMAMLS